MNDPLAKRNAVHDPENSGAEKYMKAHLQRFREEASIISK